AVRVVEDELAQLAQRRAGRRLIALPRRRREEELARDLPVVGLGDIEARVRDVGVGRARAHERAVRADRLGELVLDDVAVGDAQLGQRGVAAVRKLPPDAPEERVGREAVAVLERLVRVLVAAASVLAVAQRALLVGAAGGHRGGEREEREDRGEPLHAAHRTLCPIPRQIRGRASLASLCYREGTPRLSMRFSVTQRALPALALSFFLAAPMPALAQETAVEGLRSAARAAPRDYDAQVAFGRALLEAGRYREAHAQLQRASRLRRGDAAALYEVARVAVAEHDQRRARPQCR